MAQAPIKHTDATADSDIVSTFHPVIAEWFRRRFSAPTDAQAGGWPQIQSGRDLHIAAQQKTGHEQSLLRRVVLDLTTQEPAEHERALGVPDEDDPTAVVLFGEILAPRLDHV